MLLAGSNALLWISQKPSHLLSSRGDFIGVHTGQLEDTFGVAITAAWALSSCTMVAAAVQWAERIMRKVENAYSDDGNARAAKSADKRF